MLGICIVYLAPDQDSFALLRMGLSQINALTSGPFRIFGHALRMPDWGVSLLDGWGVERPELTTFEGQPYFTAAKPQAGEHIHYIDRLVDAAVGAGCEHIAVFDMDSWPIVSRWNCHYLPQVQGPNALVSVQRSEIGDNFPHPSFSLFGRSLWTPGVTSFGIAQRSLAAWEEVADVSRPTEPGVGILVEVRRRGLGWQALERSNLWNPHSLMCGIYDHRIFHFGAGSRTPYFALDRQDYKLHGNRLRREHRLFMNRAERRFYLDALAKQPERFIRALNGERDPVQGLR